MGFDPTSFNPSSHAGGSGELIPPGTYVCFAMKADRKNDRGKPQIDFLIQPIINTTTGEVQSDEIAPLFETATLTEKAVWRFANMCEAIQTGPFNANSDQEVRSKILGKPFKVVVVKDTYQGTERRKISQYQKLNSADEKRFAQWHENAALEGKTSVAGNTENHVDNDSFTDSSTTNSSSGDFADDDIPF